MGEKLTRIPQTTQWLQIINEEGPFFHINSVVIKEHPQTLYFFTKLLET